MSDDHLSNETGLSIAVTDTGLDLKAKSRAISAVDRFLGGLFDRFNPDIERPAQIKRAKAARADLIDAAITEKMIEAIHANPEIGQRALEQHLGTVARRAENKAAIVTLALEDLRDNPPTDEQSAAGPPELDPDFSNRLERYAEDATSDQLRERWGRVLAAEVRAPGTFSQKVLRAVDELDADTATLFERIVAHRLQESIPVGVMGELKFQEKIQLIEAGLLVDPGLSHQIQLSSDLTHEGIVWEFVPFGTWGIAISAEREGTGSDKFLTVDDRGKPAVPIYLLTKTGAAIASILPHDDQPTFEALTKGVVGELAKAEVRTYRRVGDDKWTMTGKFQKPAPTFDFGGPSAFSGVTSLNF